MPIENDPIKGEESEQQSRLGVAIAEYLLATDSQQEFDVQAWLDRHADIAEPLQAFIANQSEFHQLLCSSTNSSTARASLALTPTDLASEGAEAAYRTHDQLDFVVSNDGFRPARTLPPE